MTPGNRHYAIVTAAYWGFTLSDGALRMLVLLHFYRLGYSPFTLAFLFLLYEAMGVVANLIGGWLATRYGIARMLAIGLATQIAGFLLLSALAPGWTVAMSVAWVVVAQGICGVAKDLTKTASKSAIKLTAGGASGQLFKWVAFFTGSKNAMKGVGFFLGGVLLQTLGFQHALWALSGLLSLVLLGVLAFVPRLMGKSQASKSARELFAKNRGINLLAAARVALFGARDVWFVVGVPVFLYSAGWTFTMVGGFLALWTIGYGAVQALAPAVVPRSADGLSSEVPAAQRWSALLALVPIVLAGLVLAKAAQLEWIVVAGLGVFGFVFAVNSSVHSYLVLAYAGSEKAAEDVGFYYAANAMGRFFGTLMSGLLYQWGGLAWSLAGSAALLVACWLVTLALPTRLPRAVAAGAGARQPRRGHRAATSWHPPRRGRFDTMTDDTEREAAELLWQHRCAGTVLDALPAALRPTTSAQGHAIQAQWPLVAGQRVVGWKIAATSEAGQKHINVSGPLAGRILSSFVVDEGAAVSLAGNRMRVVEPEFAFRIGRDLPPRATPYAAADVLDAVASLHPAFEIPDSRYAVFTRVGEAQLIADDACCGPFVLGRAAPPGWRELDLSAHRVQASVSNRDGVRFTREGAGRAALGDPRAALTWLANELSSLGLTLAAGQFVSTGTCMVPLEVEPGDAVHADFGALGALALRLGA